MSLKLVINVSKKIPGRQEYSSIMSSCSIESEISLGQDPVAEAARLQAQAQAAVDQFLGISPLSQPALLVAPQTTHQATSGNSSQQSARLASRVASQPYRSSGQRRGPAPVTDSQLRFLTRLIDQTKSSLPAILDHHQVGGLDQLSCKDAADLIDELKARVPA